MADLKQGSISFPWEMYLQAQAMKNQNLQDMYGNIQGIGTNAGKIGVEFQKQKARQDLMNALNSVRGGQVPGSPVAGQGGATTPAEVAGQGSPAPSLGQLAALQQTGFPDQQNPYANAMANQFDPEKQAIIHHLLTESNMLPIKTASDIQHQRTEEENQLLLQSMAREERKRAAEAADFTRNWMIQSGVDKNKADLATKHPFAMMMPWSQTRKSLDTMKGPFDSGVPTPAPGFGGSSTGWSIKRKP